MYLIILSDEMRIAAKVQTYQQACLIAELDFQDNATHVMPNEPRSWSHFGRLDLQMLIRNHGFTPPSVLEYSVMAKQAMEIAEGIALDQRSILALESKAGPKPLPGDVREIEKRPEYQPVSVPCKGAPPSVREPSPASSGPRAAPTKGATGRVWEIADNLIDLDLDKSSINVKELRQKVIAACEAEGLNPGTAATQFGKWKKERGL